MTRAASLYCAGIVLAAAFSLAAAVPRTAQAASWPLFRGTTDRSGAIAEQAAPTLTPRWNYAVSGEIVSSPVAYKGIVYFGARDGSLWALDAVSGEVVWQYSTSGWIDATPCVSSDTVYVPSRDMNVYAFDRLTGAVRWQTFTGSMDCSSPVIENGKLYFLSGYPERCIYCLDAARGTILARYPVSLSGFSSPAVCDGALYIGTNDGKFHCLDLSSGRVKWEIATMGAVFFSTLAAGDAAVYAVAGGDERRLFCLNPVNGQTIWRSTPLDDRTAAVSSAAVGKNNVYAAATSGNALRLYAFPRGDGAASDVAPSTSVVIGIPHPSGIISSPCIADDTIYIGSGDGRLYCIDAASGKYIEPGTGNLSDAATGYYLCHPASRSAGIVASPAVSNGWIYAATCDGRIWGLQAGRATAIAAPDNGEKVVNGTEVRGIVVDPSPAAFALECGRGESPAQWTLIAASSGTGAGGSLGYWNTAALADDIYTLRLTAGGDPARRAVNRVVIDNSPRPPSNLTVTDTPFDGGNSVTLSWVKSPDDGAGDVAGYVIYKSTYAGGYAFRAKVAPATTRYIDADCPPHTTFYYVVTAVDASSESACSLPAAGFSLVDGVRIAAAAGGTVSLDVNGQVTEVLVDPGSLSADAWIGVRIPEPSDSGIPKSARDTGIVREFGITPPDARFLTPVTVKIPYRPQDVLGMDRENLRIYWLDESRGEWRMVNTSDPDSEDGRVWARLPHFSQYRVMAYVPGSDELLESGNVYATPNPATGDRVCFKYRLGDRADVTADVYNVAGELMAHIEKPANPAGLVSEIEWNISGIASGVYILRLEAASSSKRVAVKKKFAVIH